MTQKIVINTCFGGFNLSEKGLDAYAEKVGRPSVEIHTYEIDRADPALVEVVETMGKEAAGPHSRLKVVEIPADVDWEIDEYDGSEHVAEKHRTWY